MSFINKNTSAICEVLIEEYASVLVLNPSKKHIEDFIFWQMQSMPDYLKLPFKVLNFGFACLVLCTKFKSFHRLSLNQKKKILAHWRESKLDPCRTFLKFYEALIVYDLCSQQSRAEAL